MGDRLENLRAARRAIASLPSISMPLLASPIYETEPVGCETGAGRFWNAVLEIGFEGGAEALLARTRQIEITHGRAADHPRNVSRPIDIDLLYFGETILNEKDLQLPHPRMFSRRFVLQPLADIRPDLVVPGQRQSARELLAQVGGSATLVALPEQWS
jgi:2-amino-4-hydroxy-6-hydroxymethyldihydropteridine diphosphokinase